MSAGRTLFCFLAMSGLGLSLPVNAFAYALTCDTYKKYGYQDKTYFTNDSGVAKRCGYAFDKKSCNFTGNASNCKWEGSVARAAAPPAAAPAPAPAPTPALSSSGTIGNAKPAASAPLLKQGLFPLPKIQPPKSESEKEAGDQYAPTALPPSPTATALAPEKPGVSSALLAEAKREAEAAAEKMEEMQSTMADIRVLNEQNAVLYREPDADLKSLARMYDDRNAGLSGALASSEVGSENRKKILGQENGRHLASSPAAKGTEKDAAEISSATPAAAESAASASASDDPWLNYLSETSKSAWIERLRGNSSLRDALQARIAELQSGSGHANEGLIDFLEELLTESAGEEPASLKNLLPISAREAFSMDSKETEAEIRGLLADLNVPGDPQLLPQESLFERVSFAHRRSLVRGSLKP